MEAKICTECSRELPLTDFVRVRGGGLSHMCRECRSESIKDGWVARRIKNRGGGIAALFRS